MKTFTLPFLLLVSLIFPVTTVSAVAADPAGTAAAIQVLDRSRSGPRVVSWTVSTPSADYRPRGGDFVTFSCATDQ